MILPYIKSLALQAEIVAQVIGKAAQVLKQSCTLLITNPSIGSLIPHLRYLQELTEKAMDLANQANWFAQDIYMGARDEESVSFGNGGNSRIFLDAMRKLLRLAIQKVSDGGDLVVRLAVEIGQASLVQGLISIQYFELMNSVIRQATEATQLALKAFGQIASLLPTGGHQGGGGETNYTN